MPGVRVVSDPHIEIAAVCEVHDGSGRLVIKRESDRIMLYGRADHCCVITLESAAVIRVFDVLGEWLA